MDDIKAIVYAIEDFLDTGEDVWDYKAGLIATRDMLVDIMKGRNKLLLEDDRWKTKGGGHKVKEVGPMVCPSCLGHGFINDDHTDYTYCPMCDGIGEVTMKVR